MFLVFGFFLEFVVWEVSAGRIIAGLQGPHPPPASYGVNKEAFDKDVINSVNFAWSAGRKNDDGYIWEKSGLFEGDIMFYKDDYKNGIIDKSRRWKNATIPFYIEEKHFSDEEIRTILLGIKEFHKKTCLRLRPYKTDDENWIIITGNSSGCWSSLGMKGKGGQHLNLNSPKCVKKGVVMHEILHAAGFFHQQSSSNRDDYVTINWENIAEGHLSNFNKYNESYVSNFGAVYDYNSIMHYSRKAFSKNGKLTIVALKNETAKLGQRIGFSEIDIARINSMYDKPCHPPEKEKNQNIIEWFSSLKNY